MWRLFAATAALALLAGCGSDETRPVAAAPTSEAPAPVTLADGREATPQQAAFLAAVLPKLADERAVDSLFVLNEGEAMCRLFPNPGDPAQQDEAVTLLLSTGHGWTRTEATVLVRQAAANFCPNRA